MQTELRTEPTTANQAIPSGTFLCPTCGKSLEVSRRVLVRVLRPALVERMRADFPEWDGEFSCRRDVHLYRVVLLRESMEAERGGIDSLEAIVLDRMARKELIAKNIGSIPEGRGSRIADAVARFGGSWRFLGIFGSVIVLWMATNVALLQKAFDPYPFILLNLVLSCLAAIQAPVIMMSQNRHAEKDRQRAEHDYQVNLKAELEVQLLHEKLDHLMLGEWGKLLDVQLLQTEMLEDLTTPSESRAAASAPA